MKISARANRISPDGISFVAKLEGFKSKAYRCEAGKWTIGYGETEGVKEGDTISEPLARENLEIKLTRLSEKVLKLVKVPLTQNQLDALTSFVYNAGVEAFRNSTLLQMLNLNCYETTPHQMLRWKWITEDGYKVISKGLFERRIKEAELWSNGSKQSYLVQPSKEAQVE